jgi:hypothetical protein
MPESLANGPTSSSESDSFSSSTGLGIPRRISDDTLQHSASQEGTTNENTSHVRSVTSFTITQQHQNPAYPHLQRLLAYLQDIYDLVPAFKSVHHKVQLVSSIHGSSSNLALMGRSRSANNALTTTHHHSVGAVQNTNPLSHGLTPVQREKLLQRQNPTRRTQIAAEILKTERTYVKELQNLVDLYIRPLERDGFFSPADVNLLFGNVKSILLFHERHLLPDLQRAMQDPEQRIGAVFLRAAPFMKMYSVYYNNCDTATEFISALDQIVNFQSESGALGPTVHVSTSAGGFPSSLNLSSGRSGSSGGGFAESISLSSGFAQHPTLVPAVTLSSAFINSSLSPNNSSPSSRKSLAKKFHKHCKQAKSNPSHMQISLHAYLVLPVQRLPRYKLLMDQLLESTRGDHPDRLDLEKAAEAVRDRVEECNNKKREKEELERGVRIMSRIKVRRGLGMLGGVRGGGVPGADLFTHVRIGRRLVKEGVVRVVKCIELRESDGGSSVNDGEERTSFQFDGGKSYYRNQQARNGSGGGGRIDAAFAVHFKSNRAFQTLLGPLMETRFAMDGFSANSLGSQVTTVPPVTVIEDPYGISSSSTSVTTARPIPFPDGLATYGLQRTTGRDFKLFLFTDVLCWCKEVINSDQQNNSISSPLSQASTNDQHEYELIRAFDLLTPQTTVELMPISEWSRRALAEMHKGIIINTLQSNAMSAPVPPVPASSVDMGGTSPKQGGGRLQRKASWLLRSASFTGGHKEKHPHSESTVHSTNESAGSHSVRSVMSLSIPRSLQTQMQAVLRISDGEAILFLMGSLEEMEEWRQTFVNLGCTLV